MSDSMASAVASVQPDDAAISGGGQNGVLGQLGQMLQLGQAYNNYRQNKQQIDARQAMGPILQDSIDPSTGQVDYNKAFVGMASNPTTAYLAPQFLQQGLQNQSLQMDVVGKGLDQAKKQFSAMGEAAEALLGNKDSTRADLFGSLAGLVNQGVVTKKQAMAYAQMAPSDPQDFRKFLEHSALQIQDHGKALDTVLGSLQTTNTGGQTWRQRYMPLSGEMDGVRGGTMTMTPTPDQLNAPQPTMDEQGNQRLSNAYGSRPMVDGAGRPINGVDQAGGVVAPSSQVQDYLQGKGPIATEYEPDLDKRVQTANTVKQNYHEQLDLLHQMQAGGSSGTGGGIAARQHLAQLAQAAGMPESTVNAIAGGDYAAASQFAKLSVTNAMDQLHASAGHDRTSQSEFEHFRQNLPNLSMTPKAISGILNYLDSQAEIPIAEQQGFNNYKQFKNWNPNRWPSVWEKMLYTTKKLEMSSKLGRDAFQTEDTP